MISIKIGERVGVIYDNDKFLGYGVYEGNFIPVEAVGFLAGLCRDGNVENPRIRLDSGDCVYGCECWWGPEEKVKDILKNNLTIKSISIIDIRNEYLNREGD